MITVGGIAQICHEANRAYCASIGDMSQPPWNEAPEWQKQSAYKGVQFHLDGDHPPSASHDSWFMEKVKDGWKYGPVKNPETKEHPCMVAFEDLPPEQQLKDKLFKAVVEVFKT